ncbi:hypothetical protein FRC20_007066 [Serendipita sp. 405]|nr:hypothetical protein FRC20_007066 [Serendipita sp. 405]
MSSSTPSSPKQFSSSKLPLLNVSQCTRSEFHSFLTHSQVAEEVSLFDPSDEDPFRSECVVLQSSTSEASSFSSSIANSMSWSSSGSSTGSESRVLRHFPTNRDETPIWIALQEENENCSPGNILDFPRDSQVSPFTNHKSGDNCHVLYQERESVASIELLNALGLMNLVQGPEPVVQKKVMPASKIPRLSARYGRMYGKEHHILSLKNSRETIRQSKIPRPIKRIEPDVHRFSGHFTTSTISGYSNSMIPRPPKWFRDPSSQIQSTRFSQGHSQPKSRFSISPAIASPKTKWPKIPRFRRQCRPIVPREGLALIIPSRDDSRITPAHKASLPNLPLPMPEVSGRWSTDWDEVVDGIVKGNTDGSSSTDKQLKGKPSRINRAVVHQRRPSHTRRYLPHASSERAQRRFAGLFNFNVRILRVISNLTYETLIVETSSVAEIEAKHTTPAKPRKYTHESTGDIDSDSEPQRGSDHSFEYRRCFER